MHQLSQVSALAILRQDATLRNLLLGILKQPWRGLTYAICADRLRDLSFNGIDSFRKHLPDFVRWCIRNLRLEPRRAIRRALAIARKHLIDDHEIPF